MALFGRRSLREELERAGLTDILAGAEQIGTVALYDVRRIIHAVRGDPARKGPAWRSVRTVATGERETVLSTLRERAEAAGASVVFEAGAWRAHLIRRGSRYPTRERMLVVGPAGVADKQRASFEQRWRQLERLHDVVPVGP